MGIEVMEELMAKIKGLVNDKELRLPLIILVVLAIVVFGWLKRKRILNFGSRVRTRVRKVYVRSRGYARRRFKKWR